MGGATVNVQDSGLILQEPAQFPDIGPARPHHGSNKTDKLPRPGPPQPVKGQWRAPDRYAGLAGPILQRAMLAQHKAYLIKAFPHYLQMLQGAPGAGVRSSSASRPASTSSALEW